MQHDSTEDRRSSRWPSGPGAPVEEAATERCQQSFTQRHENQRHGEEPGEES